MASTRSLLILAVGTLVVVIALVPFAVAQSSDPLLQLLKSKGVLTAEEAAQLQDAPAADQRAMLERMLRDKGVITAEEYDRLHPRREFPGGGVGSSLKADATPAAAPAPPVALPIIPAIAPIRAMQLEPAKPGGLIPDIKLGSGANLKIYGLLKASAIYDSSSPLGTDMPLPGFFSDTGPGPADNFHVKARFFRAGVNFEWPDVSKKVALTGKFEFDFEGNFTRALNRNISTIRSSQASIRLAWGRLDYKWNERDSMFVLFGQDWTPFGSSTLPNLYETTGLGLGFGTLYERNPQFRIGYGHQFDGERKFRVQPEFAIVLPASGNGPTDVGSQLGMGERQGADAGHPELQARMVLQFQLDKAAAVPPAQFIVSGVSGSREAIVLKSAVPLCADAACPSANIYRDTFPEGANLHTDRWGWSAEMQLPTRYVTVLAKYWTGADLRFYFVGSLFSTFTDATGMTALASANSIDGASSVYFGLLDGDPIMAPQRAVRAQGGFINLGFPLSRIFGANPEGRNAGWQLHLHYAYDEAKARDVRFLPATSSSVCGLGVSKCNNRQKNDLLAATLSYRMNKFVSFVWEQSYYRTRAVGTEGIPNPLWMGKPSSDWHNVRSEFGPLFTF